MIRFKGRQAIVLAVFATALGCSGNRPPTQEELEGVLQAEYGSLVRVTEVQRINGVDYPAGNGAPQRYEVHFAAVLVPTGPVTLRMSSALESAALAGSSSGAIIKGLSEGHVPDPQGLNVFFDIGTELLRIDESIPPTIMGAVVFLKTENGWQKQTLQSQVPRSFVQSVRVREQLAGDWYDGGPSCMKIARGANTATWAVKVWYCEAGEPPASVSATMSVTGMELSGDDGVFNATIEPDGALKATFTWGLPNDPVQEGTFRKSRP